MQCPDCAAIFEVVEHQTIGARVGDKIERLTPQFKMVLEFLLWAPSNVSYDSIFHLGDINALTFEKIKLAAGFLEYLEEKEIDPIHEKIANAGTWDFKISVLVRKGCLQMFRKDAKVYYRIMTDSIRKILKDGSF